METATCAICSEPLPAQKAGARRLVHSGACTSQRDKQRSKQNHIERYADSARRLSVQASGREANRKWRAKNVDSEKARRAAWRDVNRARMTESNRAYRKSNADGVRQKNLRRRARLLDAFVEDVDLKILWDQHAGHCGICGLAIDPDLAWPDKMSKTLDHVVPLSRGGKHSHANAQLAHAICNSRKNNRV